VNNTRQSINAAIAQASATDSAFREALLRDPHAAILQRFNVSIARDIPVFVHEESPAGIHIVIPPRETGALSDDQLDGVSGGVSGPRVPGAPYPIPIPYPNWPKW